jgi:hypothetical protein
VYYKYYDVLPPNVRDYLFNTLLSARGWYDPGEQYSVNIDGSITIPETENHRVMIQAAKYLANQLWFQQTHDHGNYDNNRNGNGGGNPPMVDVILGTLRNYLTADFVEYNARPYQEYTMTALLNLASYAYDDRVKLAARMVLDYISAKVAVSSNDLRRSTPFRRRNEAEQWGPSYSDGSLGTGLVFDQREPQTPFFAQLAGNTQILRRQPPASYRWGMVRAAVGDYRVPPAILDLFVNPAHRRFYQVFKHASGADPKQYGIELYAASPSYLISAGGNPTFYAYVADVAGITYLGDSVDLGVALPTTFMPTAPPFPYTSDGGITLVNIVQLGQLTTGVDSTTVHFGVAPDFACGDTTYLPAVYADISSKIVTEPHWTFIDRSSDSSHPGYFLAVYHQFDNPVGGYGFMEAFDTWLHPGYTFDQFINGGNGLTGVWTTYRSTVFSGDGVNTYVTQLGQQIQFTMSAQSEIVATTALPQPSGSIFAYGTILNSGEGSAVITISNPGLGTQITLNMNDYHHPFRISESGQVEAAGANQEVWVDFNYVGTGPTQAGDFGDPFKTLAAAVNAVAGGGTIKIVPGSKIEPMIITKPMTLVSFPGSAVLGHN